MRPIDADAFVKRREDWLKSEMQKDGHTDYQSGYLMGVRATLFELQDERLAPTVDAEPVRHEHWIEKTNYNLDTYYTCSSCGEDFCTIDGTPKDNGWNYCPNCGAKMDGGE